MLILNVGLECCNERSWSLTTDYVQVVDMGTLELRITAVKPGIDGKLVRLVIAMNNIKSR